MYQVRVNPLKLSMSLVSLMAFLVCFFYAYPIEPTADAIKRFSMASNPSVFLRNLLELQEPFGLLIAFLSPSPNDYLITYSLIAILICSTLLRVPLWVIGLFVLLPQGYLLAFNITPSLIAFSVVNFSLIYTLKPLLILFGITNHLLALLSVARVALQFIWFTPITKFLLFALIVWFYYSFEGLISAKLNVYSGADGNVFHSLSSLLLLMVIILSRRKMFMFASFVYLVVITFSMIISTKISSRFAFGVDLLFIQFIVMVARTLLYKISNRQNVNICS